MSEHVIMVNGLPGKMATLIAKTIMSKYSTYEYSLTGEGQPETFEVDTGIRNSFLTLCPPEKHSSVVKDAAEKGVIAIDFVKGKGEADKNASLYLLNKIPFVMGSTGADYKMINNLAKQTQTPCVAYPNMDKRIVTWMAMFQYAAEQFKGAFEGVEVGLEESHQASKPDTSGTMKEMVQHIARLTGQGLTVDDITKIRTPGIQSNLLNVPEEWMGQHAYHFFRFEDPQAEAREELIFKRHGGATYLQGTMTALDFLIDVIENNKTPMRYTMIDVLRRAS